MAFSCLGGLWTLYGDTDDYPQPEGPVGSSENCYTGRSFSPQASSPVAPQYPHFPPRIHGAKFNEKPDSWPHLLSGGPHPLRSTTGSQLVKGPRASPCPPSLAALQFILPRERPHLVRLFSGSHPDARAALPCRRLGPHLTSTGKTLENLPWWQPCLPPCNSPQRNRQARQM